MESKDGKVLTFPPQATKVGLLANNFYTALLTYSPVTF